MAFSSHFLIFCALLISSCSADDFSDFGISPETSTIQETTDQTGTFTSTPQQTISSTPNTVTAESTKTTFVTEPTAPTHSETPETVKTTATPDPTTPNDKTTTESVETTTIQETSAQIGTLTSTPQQTISSTPNTVTAESTETTFVTEPTAPTHSETPETVKTTATPDPTTPNDKTTTEPVETTTIQETSAQTSTLTSAPQQTTPSPSSGPTTEPLICQNGGTSNGTDCLCLDTFTGEFCQFVKPVVQPDELEQAVEVNVVINQVYIPDYDHDSTPKYKELVQNFTERMKKYYLAIPVQCKEVVVTDISPGGDQMRLSAEAMVVHITPRENGISITHDVILGIPNNASSEEEYEKDFEKIQKSLEDLLNCTEGSSEPADCPYKVTRPPTVNRTEFDSTGFCEKSLPNADLAKYYEMHNASGVLKCVSGCDKEYEQYGYYQTCNGHGTCRVYRDTGITCECNALSSTWYLGEDCALPINQIAFYVGLSATLTCLLVTVAGLTAYLLINKRKQTKKKDIKEKLVNEWMNEDMEWSRANSPQSKFNAGDYQNPSFTHEESGIHRGYARDYTRPVPLRQMSQPSSYNGTKPSSLLMSTPTMPQTAHRQETAFSNARYLQSPSPAQPHNDFSRNDPMSISRPQIRTSFDV